MLALMDPISATRSSASLDRPATRNNVRIRLASPSRKRAPAMTRFENCLRRCGAAGIRLVVTTPANHRAFSRGVRQFSERQIDMAAHARWDTAYRIFSGRANEEHDRASWRILAVDREDRVVGAVTGRFFCGEVMQDALHMLSLLESTGPVFREHCELAIAEVIAATTQEGRTLAEVSHWAVAPVWHAALIGVTLIRAMGALVVAFEAPLALIAADNRRTDVTRLMRLGSLPLSLSGRSCLPPFVHHESGAWLRLLVLDAAAFHVRNGGAPVEDLALLRDAATIVSVG